MGLPFFSKPKARPLPAPVVTAKAPSGPSASEIAERKDDERRKRTLALNAGGNAGQLTPAGGVQGQASLARKQLMGL